MRASFLIPVLCAAGTALGAQQQAAGARDEALRAVIAAERGFARQAGEVGIRDAFLANIADDGVLFRPRVVEGKKWLEDHPPPPGSRAVLAWDPQWADVAASGELGYTHGPFESRRTPEDSVAGRGTYATVWKKQPDGSWKYVIDLGAPGPTVYADGDEVRSPRWSAAAKPVATPAAKSDPALRTRLRDELLALDRRLGSETVRPAASSGGGDEWPFARHVGEGTQILRAGKAVVTGPDAARAALAERPGRYRSAPIGGDVAISGDLAYTYGTYEQGAERGNYLRVWRRSGGGSWAIALDVASPVRE